MEVVARGVSLPTADQRHMLMIVHLLPIFPNSKLQAALLTYPLLPEAAFIFSSAA